MVSIDSWSDLVLVRAVRTVVSLCSYTVASFVGEVPNGPGDCRRINVVKRVPVAVSRCLLASVMDGATMDEERYRRVNSGIIVDIVRSPSV
ncbi:hypothetical protein HSRCO_1713 [Halanaeroarchaeum sp. HSR-CO]|nr:hypothetical protein HSRCO_1713 [Halanaeroarchaeum sp. HSR-CO]